MAVSAGEAQLVRPVGADGADGYPVPVPEGCLGLRNFSFVGPLSKVPPLNETICS